MEPKLDQKWTEIWMKLDQKLFKKGLDLAQKCWNNGDSKSGTKLIQTVKKWLKNGGEPWNFVHVV